MHGSIVCHSAPNPPAAKPCSKVAACLGVCSPQFCGDSRGEELLPRGVCWYLLIPAGLLTCSMHSARGSSQGVGEPPPHRDAALRHQGKDSATWAVAEGLGGWVAPIQRNRNRILLSFCFIARHKQALLAAFWILFFPDLSWWVLPRRTIISWRKIGKFLCIKFSWAVTHKGPHTADTVSGNQVTQFNCTEITDAVSLTH